MDTGLPGDVLERIPGWSDAECRPLADGTSGSAWLLEKNGSRAVLKVDDGPRDPALNRRPDEARIQRAAHEAGVAPAVLYVAENMLLSDYVAGSALDAVADRPTLDALARSLRRVHALPATGRVFDAPAAAQRYADLAAAREVDQLLVQHHLDRIAAGSRPGNLCCCHNDLVGANIIVNGAPHFIDWEYACDNDPLFDLASIVCELRLSTGQVARLLDAYFDGTGDNWREQLARQKRIYESLAWLWRAAH
jgi:thiamine kinase-like enzyme